MWGTLREVPPLQEEEGKHDASESICDGYAPREVLQFRWAWQPLIAASISALCVFLFLTRIPPATAYGFAIIPVIGIALEAVQLPEGQFWDYFSSKHVFDITESHAASFARSMGVDGIVRGGRMSRWYPWWLFVSHTVCLVLIGAGGEIQQSQTSCVAEPCFSQPALLMFQFNESQAILQLAISLPVIFFYVALCITCACSLREATPSSQLLMSTQLLSLSPEARSAVRTAELHATSACTTVYAPTVKKLKIFISLGVTLLYIAIVFGIYNQYVNVGNFLLTIVASVSIFSSTYVAVHCLVNVGRAYHVVLFTLRACNSPPAPFLEHLRSWFDARSFVLEYTARFHYGGVETGVCAMVVFDALAILVLLFRTYITGQELHTLLGPFLLVIALSLYLLWIGGLLSSIWQAQRSHLQLIRSAKLGLLFEPAALDAAVVPPVAAASMPTRVPLTVSTCTQAALGLHESEEACAREVVSVTAFTPPLPPSPLSVRVLDEPVVQVLAARAAPASRTQQAATVLACLHEIEQRIETQEYVPALYGVVVSPSMFRLAQAYLLLALAAGLIRVFSW